MPQGKTNKDHPAEQSERREGKSKLARFFSDRPTSWWLITGIPTLIALLGIISVANDAFELAERFNGQASEPGITASPNQAADGAGAISAEKSPEPVERLAGAEIDTPTPSPQPEPTATPTPPVRVDVKLNGPCGYPCPWVYPDWTPEIAPDSLERSYEYDKTYPFAWQDPVMPEEFIGYCGGGLYAELGVTSLVSDEWIRFEPDLLAEVVSLEPLEGEPHLVLPDLQGAGSFNLYELRIDEAAGETSRFSATSREESPDFYTLEPGEQEWFEIELHCDQPGVYTIALGVTYSYQGDEGAIFSEDTLRVARPETPHIWWLTPLDSWFLLYDGIGAWNPETGMYDPVETDAEQYLDQWLVGGSD